MKRAINIKIDRDGGAPLCLSYEDSMSIFQLYKLSVFLQTEGSTQTMGRVILECEHFVPALIKFVTMNVNIDGAVTSSEPYLVSVSLNCSSGKINGSYDQINRSSL